MKIKQNKKYRWNANDIKIQNKNDITIKWKMQIRIRHENKNKGEDKIWMRRYQMKIQIYQI